jgi:hypothetical protein
MFSFDFETRLVISITRSFARADVVITAYGLISTFVLVVLELFDFVFELVTDLTSLTLSLTLRALDILLSL